MNSSSTRTITFEHTIKVEASEAAFEFLDAMSFLDIDRLADVDEARIEIGTVVSDCCRRLVRGVVEKGILTAIEFEPDEEEPEAAPGDVDPGLVELLEAASAALGIKAPSRDLPIPLTDLIATPQIVSETWTCVRACAVGICITCCWGKTLRGSYRVCGPIDGRFPRLPIP
jgi:hypothetical protein